jgi:hypothetical protein
MRTFGTIELFFGLCTNLGFFASFDVLSQTGFPLENYQFLLGEKLVQTFKSSVAGLQGYAALRKALSWRFWGPAQAIKDLKVW